MPSTRLLAALIPIFIGLWPVSAVGSDGHHCVRIDDGCWQCVDLSFPAKVPCAQSDACGPCEVCADRGGMTTCLQPRVVCCDNPPCREPPGCARAERSCRDIGADGMLDECVLMESCLPRQRVASVAPLCQASVAAEPKAPASETARARRGTRRAAAPKPRAEARAERFWRSLLRAPMRWFGVGESVAEPLPARARHAPSADSAESS